MDKLPAIIVMAVFGVILQPPITEVGISGGPHWPEIDARETFRRTAIGLTAHTALNEHFGVQFGGGYKQGGISLCVARAKEETTLPAQRQAPIGVTPPCVLPSMLETHEAETVHRLYDYIDFSMLGQARGSRQATGLMSASSSALHGAFRSSAGGRASRMGACRVARRHTSAPIGDL